MYWAPRLNADGIKAITAVTWILATVWFALGLFIPEVRSYRRWLFW